MNGFSFDTKDVLGFMGTCFSGTNEKQSKGISCKEDFKRTEIYSAIPEESSFSESEVDSDQESICGLYGFLIPEGTPQNYCGTEVSTKDEKPLKHLPPTQENTTRSGTTQSSGFMNSDSSNILNSSRNQNRSMMNGADMMEQEEEEGKEGDKLNAQRNNEDNGEIEIEPPQNVQTNYGTNSRNSHAMETEETAHILQKEEKGGSESGAGSDDDSSQSVQKEMNTDAKRGKSNKKSTRKKNLPSIFMVRINRAYKYYRTPQKGKKEYELKSIKRVFDDEKKKVDDKTLESFDKFMKGCNAKLKTYQKCIEFIDGGKSRRVKELFKKFIAYIFKYENEEWLKGSITKNKKFWKELDSFKTNLSLALGIPQKK